METNELKSYQLRLQCQKCGKFIDIDFYVKLNERNQYGKEEECWPSILPKYLELALIQIPELIENESHIKQSYRTQLFGTPLTTAANIAHQPIQQAEPLIRCQECIKLDKLKE